MQRRAAAVYFVLFVLLGAGAYGFMQVGMSKPAVDLEGQGETFTQGQEFQVDGRTYTVMNVSSSMDGGDVTYTGNLSWFNESARETAAIENDSTIAFDGDDYRVVIPNETGVSSMTLVESFNVSAILADDPEVENETGTQGDVTYVFYTNGSRVPLSEYLPTPQTTTLAVGDEFTYEPANATARVDAITPAEASVSWSAPGTEYVEMTEGENVTLNEQTYFAHFPNDIQIRILQTDQHYGDYNQELDKVAYWEERHNGVWGIVILSVLAAIVLVATAYLPTKG